MRLALLPAILLLIAACGPANDASDAEADADPPNAGVEPIARLRAKGSVVHLTAPARSFPKGALFYALGEASPKGGPRARIGVAQVVDAESLSIKWLCGPPESAMGGVLGAGLAVEPLRPDGRAKVGKCWGSYSAQEADAWDRRPASAIYIPLRLGRRDGVRAWDYYEVLSNPVVAEDKQTVIQFRRIALCVVQPVGLLERSSVCRIDPKAWPAFNKEAWTRDGVVWLAQEAPAPKLEDKAPSPRKATAEPLLKRPQRIAIPSPVEARWGEERSALPESKSPPPAPASPRAQGRHR
jgi:hypothetical protein